MADGLKKYTLMHKEVPVADLELDAASGTISAIGPVFAPSHVPPGIPSGKGGIDRAALNEWWRGRGIPASRWGLKDALLVLNLSAAEQLLEKCLGLSLSDQYWIRPAKSGIGWSQINFFEHPFSEDMGNILFGKKASGEEPSLMSPDNTSDGWLKKKWKIAGGKRCLIKGGSGATRQEPYNEVIASRIMKRLSIPCASYSLLIEEEEPYSVCENFITHSTELISAWYVMKTRKKPNHVSLYEHYLNCCEALGIPQIKEALDRMLILDFLIVNEDRHQNNFGVVRNAETLEYEGAAPIYDSGSSLWFDKPTALIGSGAKVKCKPFKSRHEEQIKLVSSFDWFDPTALRGIDEELREILSGSIYIDERRRDALCRAISQRVAMLAEIACSQAPLFAVGQRGDVAEDVAYAGNKKG